MDVDQFVRQQKQPELPSDEMEEKFELWDKEYTLDALTDLNSSQIRSRKLEFETEVEVLLTKHRPGRSVANSPSLASIHGKPPYNAQEWERAREIIRNEAQKVRLRLERAEGIVTQEETEAKRGWIRNLVEALPSPNVNINLP
ncbi:hypothetical protein BRC82_09695 [Halobacteriales archaeon QS_1_67_19]|nr:MAG: hypothetical protein BRC82_09695 [Halobacteriales archaeon QS_1_67_19]